jgi:NAD+ kinase
MLRALARFLGSNVPVIGVNYGRVGFLTAIAGAELDAAMTRVFAGDYRTVELATLEVTVDGVTSVAINDVVVAGGTLGRMIEVGYSIGGEELGSQPCDGLICATPAGSTAYNLSNGGPVLVRGLDAMAVTFIAPHSLHARPLVVPRGPDVTLVNRTPDVEVAVLVDGRRVASVPAGAEIAVRLSPQRSLLATLPETSFFGRYRETFTSHP